ncbi:MAG TPA: J domain-containing protein [Myxococcales bacterium LLY-WYZ-16_1]|nr:J domain-containing protein [Myxococcales bacterium LLY-WYZ-16_1]
MSFASDPYVVLGVARDATELTIRTAFRQRVRQAHPDLHPTDPDAHERFLQIQAAFEILIDPDRRRRVDQEPDQTWEEARLEAERRRAQLSRRRRRLKRLYD